MVLLPAPVFKISFLVRAVLFKNNDLSQSSVVYLFTAKRT